MSKLFTPDDIKKYFYASCMLAVICLMAIIYMVATSGEASILMEGRDTGSGTIDVDVTSDNQAARMMVNNGEGADIRYTKTTDGKNEKLTASMDLDKGDGSRKTKFVITGKGDSAGSTIFVDQIGDGFSGTATTWIDYTDDGTSNFDMTFQVEGAQKSWRGKFYATDGSPRPTTEETIRGFGNMSIWRHYNVSIAPETPEDWLGFCAELNRDVHLSGEPGAVYVAPPGWTPDENGVLWRDNSTYYDVEKKRIARIE
ncbi:MAG TPA: hypothetical protein PLQ01_05085 [Methanothrix sp.]|nr:hypothetical protein [Methanothrix sp.]